MLDNNKRKKTNSFISMGIYSIQNGIIKEIGATEFSVLCVIVAFCDEFNESSVSQRKISEVTGMSLPTVNKAINKLLKVNINGESVLKRKFSNSLERKKYSIYTIDTHLLAVC